MLKYTTNDDHMSVRFRIYDMAGTCHKQIDEVTGTNNKQQQMKQHGLLTINRD